MDPRSDVLKLAHCADVACSSATALVIDGTFSVGMYPAITVAPDGLPVIAYYDYGRRDLEVAH